MSFYHPFYLSVTSLKYKPAQQAFQGTVKLFTSDLEDALKRINRKTVDLIHVKDSLDTRIKLQSYLDTHLRLSVNERDQKLDLIGFEIEEEAVWIYVEARNCKPPKRVRLQNSLLFDYLAGQTNIVEVEVNGQHRSGKALMPEKDFLFTF